MDGELDNELPLLLLVIVVTVVTVTVLSDTFVVVICGFFADEDVDATTLFDLLFVPLRFDDSAFVVVGKDIHCCPRGIRNWIQRNL